MRSGTGRGLLAGGAGNDKLYSAPDAPTVVAFNKGDGTDTLYTQGAQEITLSLGGGIKYEDIKIKRSGKDLYFLFNAASTDSIKVANYYGVSANQRPMLALQMLNEPSAIYAPTGTDVLRDNKVEQFNGSTLVAAFDTAYQATASLRKGNAWAVMGTLLNAHLGGSNTSAVGGDLSYLYGQSAGLANVGVVAANSVLVDASFGSPTQELHPNLMSSGTAPRMVG